MEHVVFYPAPDASPMFRRTESLPAAVQLVEHLRNDEGLTDVRVFALTEVPLSFRTYVHVEVPGEPAPAHAAPEAAVEAPVADEPVAAEPAPAPQAFAIPGFEMPAVEPAQESAQEPAQEPAPEWASEIPGLVPDAAPLALVPEQPTAAQADHEAPVPTDAPVEESPVEKAAPSSLSFFA